AMKSIILFLTFYVVSLNLLQAQVHINFGVDTSHTEVKTALEFYNSYLNEFKGSDVGNMLEYWHEDERAIRSNPDQLMYAINDLPVYSSGYPRTVFYIKPSREHVHIKTQYSGQFEDGSINILAITNHYIKIEADRAYLLS